MKNLMLAGALGLMVFGFSSCKKDYDCKCSVTVLGFTADTTISVGKLSKTDAEDQCSAKATELGISQFGGSCEAQKK